MKRIIVACGTGIATSQTVATRIQTLLENEGITGFKSEAVDIKAIESEVKHADIYVSIVPNSKLNKDLGIPVFDGIKFLTGMGQKEELEKIIKALKG